MTCFVVIGAGGLGCPALMGLQAGGARRVLIVDDDAVDLSNLQRQVLYSVAELGASKAQCAAWTLASRDREVEVRTLARRLDPDSPTLLAELLDAAPTDASEELVVLECSDSPRLKFAVHDACVAASVPVVVGGVVGWRGQAMAVDPRRPELPCYRCLFEEPPPRELAPACAAVGVIGAAAGVVGQWMATLALSVANSSPGNSPDKVNTASGGGFDRKLTSDKPSLKTGSASDRESSRAGAGMLIHFDLLNTRIQRLEPTPRKGCRHHGELC